MVNPSTGLLNKKNSTGAGRGLEMASPHLTGCRKPLGTEKHTGAKLLMPPWCLSCEFSDPQCDSSIRPPEQLPEGEGQGRRRESPILQKSGAAHVSSGSSEVPSAPVRRDASGYLEHLGSRKPASRKHIIQFNPTLPKPLDSRSPFHTVPVIYHLESSRSRNPGGASSLTRRCHTPIS